VHRALDYALRALTTNLFRWAVILLRGFRILPHPDPRPNSILIVNLTSHLGDTILQMPIIEALRAAHPEARIEVATESAAAPLLERMAEIDHVYALQLTREPPVSIPQSIRRVVEVCLCYWEQMRLCAPEICLLPRWDNDQYRSQVLALLIGAPRRIGFTWRSLPSVRPAPYRDRLLTERIAGGSRMHEAARFCLLASNAGLLPAPLDPGPAAVPALQRVASGVEWASLAQRVGIDISRPFAVIAPGASMTRRLWPIENWAEICKFLIARGAALVVLSGPSDTAIARELHEASGRTVLLVAGQTNLLESTAILAHAALFLGNDSGPGHVAGALGTPTVVLAAAGPGCDPDDPAAPARLHPLGPFVEFRAPTRNLAPCSGACHATEPHCITLIQPDEVMQAVDAVLVRAGRTLTVLEARPLADAQRTSLAR
jgi:ADP-heptose:LPS heptosyltransferase